MALPQKMEMYWFMMRWKRNCNIKQQKIAKFYPMKTPKMLEISVFFAYTRTYGENTEEIRKQRSSS